MPNVNKTKPIFWYLSSRFSSDQLPSVMKNEDEFSSDPSSCYRTLTIQFDEREKAVILVRLAIVAIFDFFLQINMFEINTEYVDIHFKRLISDGFKVSLPFQGNHRPYCCQGISFTLVNYDLKSYTRTGWMEEPIYLDYYRDTARLEGVTRFLRWVRLRPVLNPKRFHCRTTIRTIWPTRVGWIPRSQLATSPLQFAMWRGENSSTLLILIIQTTSDAIVPC